MSLSIISKDNDLLGTDKYRSTDRTVPAAFRASVDMDVSSNDTGSNHMVTIKSKEPVVIAIDGVTTAKDTFLMITKFSALQHITNDVERAQCFDNHLAFLTAARQSIIDGQLPDEPITLA